MKIETGKEYRTTAGKRVTIKECRGAVDNYFVASNGWHYKPDGECAYLGQTMIHDDRSDLHIIAEWTDPPDLTALTTPFGLLDRETQEALKAHGGPFQLWGGSKWIDRSGDDIESVFDNWYCYRVKPLPPAPPKPREWYVSGGNCLWDTYAEAYNACDRGEKPVHVREVLPD